MRWEAPSSAISVLHIGIFVAVAALISVFLVPMTLGVPLDFLISLEPCKIFLCPCHFRSGLFAISFVERGFD